MSTIRFGVRIPRVIVFIGDGVGRESRCDLLRIVVYAPRHPAGRFHATPQHVVIGVLLVMRPRVIAHDGVDLQEANQENQPADQLIARDIAHAMIAVIQIEFSLQAQDAGLLFRFRSLRKTFSPIVPGVPRSSPMSSLVT